MGTQSASERGEEEAREGRGAAPRGREEEEPPAKAPEETDRVKGVLVPAACGPMSASESRSEAPSSELLL